MIRLYRSASCLERFDQLLGEKQRARRRRAVLFDRDRSDVQAGGPQASLRAGNLAQPARTSQIASTGKCTSTT